MARALVVGLALAFAGGAFGDTTYPASWSEPARTASELGIADFHQSPFLDRAGLPPVEERLPLDPVVVEPLESIGRYGGTATIVHADWWTFFNVEPPLTIGADLRTFLPNLVESFDLSADGRRLTLKIREGIRWSDGHPLTSDDFAFTFEDLWLNEDWAPVTDRVVVGGSFEKIDDYTFAYVFDRPNPLFVNYLAQYGNFFVDPKHYFKQFHPKYVDEETLDARIRAMGFVTWNSFISANRLERIDESADLPTLRAYRIERRTPMHVRYVRNPYYFKVDPAGQQLPYIDVVESQVVENAEVIAAKAATGQLDFAGFALRTQDIPLLKMGERTQQTKVLIWQRLQSSDVALQFNFNHEDSRLRELFWDVRFRRALSLAIDRDEINTVIYFSRATPRQVTAHPTSSFYEPAWATVDAEYDPDRARSLLDELGLVDSSDDGLREFADGTPLVLTIEFYDFETPKGMTMELVTQYWREIGIDLRVKLVNGDLQHARAIAGQMQMTLWHADRVTDILLPLVPDWWVPRSVGWDRTMWNDWARWYMTDGEIGEEPPALVQELQRWTDEMRFTTDPARRVELGKNILRVGAENLWVIGTVGLAPQPIVVSSALKNVPREAIWGWDNRWTLAYHPVTWYFGDSP